MHSTYDIHKSYQENYDKGPFFDGPFPNICNTTEVEFLGKKLYSTIGVPAGPLLNEKYTTLYAKLGWDIVTYKTVRSVQRVCHPLPNCVYLPSEYMKKEDIGTVIHPQENGKDVMNITITNSFGMPSQDPNIWQRDMEKAVKNIGKKQMLIASVVGTAETPEAWVQDISHLAAIVKETGASAIELDISCPNVGKNRAGSVYLDADFCESITKACKKEIGETPLLIKVGYFKDLSVMQKVIDQSAPYIDGIVAINTIQRKIENKDGSPTLPGEGRQYGGACGRGIKLLAQETVKDIIMYRDKKGYTFVVVGCGGVTQPKDFDEYFSMGCVAALSATGAMWNPYLAQEWKKMKNPHCIN